MAKPKIADKRAKPGRIRNVLDDTRPRNCAGSHSGRRRPCRPSRISKPASASDAAWCAKPIKTLAAKGLVSVRPRHGTHVRPRHEWSLLDRDVSQLAGRQGRAGPRSAAGHPGGPLDHRAGGRSARRRARHPKRPLAHQHGAGRDGDRARIRRAPSPRTRRFTSRSSTRRTTRCCRAFAAPSTPSSARSSLVAVGSVGLVSRTICPTTPPPRAQSRAAMPEKARIAMEPGARLHEVQTVEPQDGSRHRRRATAGRRDQQARQRRVASRRRAPTKGTRVKCRNEASEHDALDPCSC